MCTMTRSRVPRVKQRVSLMVRVELVVRVETELTQNLGRPPLGGSPIPNTDTFAQTRPSASLLMSPVSAAAVRKGSPSTEGPPLKRSKGSSSFIPRALSFETAHSRRDEYRTSQPYKHAVADSIFEDSLLRRVVDEVAMKEGDAEAGLGGLVGWGAKETDIYKVSTQRYHNTWDLGGQRYWYSRGQADGRRSWAGSAGQASPGGRAMLSSTRPPRSTRSQVGLGRRS